MRVLLLVIMLALPATASAAAPREGVDLYGRYCVSCHGPNGSGGTGKAPPLRGVGARAADFYLSTGYMPLKRPGIQPRRSHLLFDRSQIDALVAYVASVGKGPGIPTPHPERGDLSAGQHAFTEHCAGCHQVAAEGGYVTGAVPPPLGDATPVQIAEAVRIGPYVMPRFGEQTISNKELDSIIRYIRWVQRHPDNSGGWALGHVGPVPEGLVTWFLAATALLAVCLVLGKRLHG